MTIDFSPGGRLACGSKIIPTRVFLDILTQKGSLIKNLHEANRCRGPEIL